VEVTLFLVLAKTAYHELHNLHLSPNIMRMIS